MPVFECINCYSTNYGQFFRPSFPPAFVDLGGAEDHEESHISTRKCNLIDAYQEMHNLTICKEIQKNVTSLICRKRK